MTDWAGIATVSTAPETENYCTLAELKERLLDMWTISASTISFGLHTISDSAYGLKRFENSDNVTSIIKVSGVTTNAGIYTVTSATPSAVIVTENMTTMAAGNTTVIQKWGMDFADPIMNNIISSASRAIDRYCKRRFYAGTETRYFTAKYYNELFVDDLLSVTTLKSDDNGDGTFENTWTANTDYLLWPFNSGTDDQAYTTVRISNSGNYYFPTNVEKGVEIVGSWGYCNTVNRPESIKEACLILASRIYRRKDAPFGVSGPNEFGQLQIIDKFDSDVKMLLSPYRRLV